ncbi:TMEM199/VMA12 family protein [Aspergillus ruber CBS 135680]|uniref:Endoplasmic reticulum-based factor for assembly of V-ATPase-domain-containing protein n=1 Tax=Aspergillus ruber (strain CBS 135680) TaxID=1388766 RepID=A0A017SNH4_ASPRC|nr:uncharacterized protein EURHEDRAFT_409488 [Aspergillus ruber CBS 135680]EYE98159.1 hypothetical protein EURHEDRAFT_409488 [Aspergillus ruber CBS 135680]
MVQLVVTTRILSAIEAIPPSRREDLDLPDLINLNSPISHEQLIGLSRYLKSNPDGHDSDSNTPTSLNSLLHGTKVYVPPPPKKPEPTPEYLAQKARLLAAVEADAYNRMTLPSSTSTKGPSPIFSSTTPIVSAMHDPNTSDTSAKDPLTPSLVLNIFLSVLLTGFSTYWALSKFSTPDILTSTVASAWRGRDVRGASEPVRVLLSLFVALLVGLAEVIIYAIYLGKAEDARVKEKRIRERKEFVGGERVGGRAEEAETDGQQVDGDEEKIWGRGANGGLRRRVREKWEEQEKVQ